MGQDPNQNPQHKRKQASSPTVDTSLKKKESKTQKTPKTPATADNDGALSAATNATDYTHDLADGYYSEEHIVPCLSKVVEALEQVCKALHLLSRERITTPLVQQLRKSDATTSTESEPPTNQKTYCFPKPTSSGQPHPEQKLKRNPRQTRDTNK